jgi:hypothetical protein
MPVFLIVLLSIIAFFFLLLCFRLRLGVAYEDGFRFYIGYLFFTIPLKTKEEKEQKKKPEKPKKKKKEKRKVDAKFFIDNFDIIAKYGKNLLSKFSSNLRVDKFDLDFTVACGDAAQTAMYYGRACAVIYPAVAFFANFVKIKRHDIKIRPDYSKDSSEVFFECVLSVRIVGILAATIKNAVGFLIAWLRKNRVNKQTAKGGAVK